MKRNHQPELSTVSQIDWARLAAYIDGEGWIGVAAQVHKPPFAGRGRYDYVKVTVTNTDARLTEWLLRNFGGFVQTRAAQINARRWKPCHVWVTGSGRAAEILGHCLPYFIVKREQAELAIAFQATMCRSGLRGTPDAVLEYREMMKTQMHQLNACGPKSVTVVDPELSGPVTH